MRIALIVPAPFDTISGGYGYDRRIVHEIRASGHAVDVVELTGAFPMTDEAARDAAHDAWRHLPDDTIPVIDGLALPAFDGMRDALSARGTIGLIHHPVSLETGLSETDRAMLGDIERRMFSRLSRLIVTSAVTGETVASAFHIPGERISVVVPGTDDAPRCFGSAGPGCEILSIGTLIPRKGHDVLLRALALIPDLDWHLTVVGSPERDPPHARLLFALAGEPGIADRVRFAGELVGEALQTAWRAADVFTLATRYEGYGMVIAEALKRGLPVVVTAGGAAGELITPDAGFVCPVGDHHAVADALRRLVIGPARRRQMAGRAWQTGRTLPSWRAQAALFARACG